MLAALEVLAARQPVSPYYAAVIHAALDERDLALDLLTRAVDERTWLASLLKVAPTFDPLRADPRFQALVERVGLGG
jgi:serine/threonine-protein kinase